MLKMKKQILILFVAMLILFSCSGKRLTKENVSDYLEKDFLGQRIVTTEAGEDYAFINAYVIIAPKGGGKKVKVKLNRNGVSDICFSSKSVLNYEIIDAGGKLERK